MSKSSEKNIKLFQLKKIQTDFPAVKIKSSRDSSDFIRQFYGDDLEVFESFFILLLNRQNHTIGYAKISQGGIVSSIVDIRLVAKYAVESLATAVILAHNHPSGNPNPSTADVKVTNEIKEALRLLQVDVLDHIILTSGSYFSFIDEGMI